MLGFAPPPGDPPLIHERDVSHQFPYSVGTSSSSSVTSSDVVSCSSSVSSGGTVTSGPSSSTDRPTVSTAPVAPGQKPVVRKDAHHGRKMGTRGARQSLLISNSQKDEASQLAAQRDVLRDAQLETQSESDSVQAEKPRERARIGPVPTFILSWSEQKVASPIYWFVAIFALLCGLWVVPAEVLINWPVYIYRFFQAWWTVLSLPFLILFYVGISLSSKYIKWARERSAFADLFEEQWMFVEETDEEDDGVDARGEFARKISTHPYYRADRATVMHRRVIVRRRVGLDVAQEGPNERQIKVSCTLFWQLVGTYVASLSDETQWVRVESALRNSASINIGENETALRADTASMAQSYMRYLRMTAITDFPLPQGSIGRSSTDTALERLRSRKFAPQMSEFELVAKEVETQLNAGWLLLLWGFTSMAPYVLRAVPITVRILFPLYTSVLLHVLLKQMLNLGECSAALLFAGYMTMSLLWELMLSWIGTSGLPIVRTRNLVKLNFVLCLMCWTLLALPILYATLPSSASLRTSRIMVTSTSVQSMPESMSLNLELVPSSTLLKSDYMSIPISSSMFQSTNVPSTYATGSLLQVLNTSLPIIPHLSHISMPNFSGIASFNSTAISLAATEMQERLSNYTFQLYQDVTTANLSMYVPPFPQNVCRERCQHLLATVSPISWFTNFSMNSSALNETLRASWKEMIVWVEYIQPNSTELWAEFRAVAEIFDVKRWINLVTKLISDLFRFRLLIAPEQERWVHNKCAENETVNYNNWTACLSPYDRHSGSQIQYEREHAMLVTVSPTSSFNVTSVLMGIQRSISEMMAVSAPAMNRVVDFGLQQFIAVCAYRDVIMSAQLPVVSYNVTPVVLFAKSVQDMVLNYTVVSWNTLNKWGEALVKVDQTKHVVCTYRQMEDTIPATYEFECLVFVRGRVIEELSFDASAYSGSPMLIAQARFSNFTGPWVLTLKSSYTKN